MTSYSDPQSARARAQVPGPSGTPGADGQPPHEERPREAPDAYRRPSGGRAVVGGSASVGSAAANAAAGRAQVGSAPTGRASVGTGMGSVGAGSGAVGAARVGGRASVGRPGGDAYGRPGTTGRAAVARAAVRPVSPGAPGYGGFDRPGGPGGGGPGGTGPGGRGVGGEDAAKRAKKRRRVNILTAAAAVMVILLGAGVVGGTWFFDGVDLPPLKTEDQSNTVLDADGKVLAKLGNQNRTVVPEASIPDLVKHAVAAAEDKNFYDHNGIDMKGIARAAWNNFSGGDTQGASTITQQYARHAAKLKEISYNRKLREAVIARKLESRYNKDEIMGYYLNAIYFGRGAYGIEAAAQAYFGKSVLTPAGKKGALTVSEAAVLASVIKQPEPVKGGHAGYDPQHEEAVNNSKVRWAYTLDNMVEMRWLSPADRQAAVYPTKSLKSPSKGCSTCAADKPVGMIMRHVKQELRAMGLTDDEQERGGLEIRTTIEPKLQEAAEESARRSSKQSPMNGLSKKYQAALVAIDPRSGEVRAYYGGDNPNGIDYAGYLDGDGRKITGGQSPASSFKIYTLAAALKENVSFETRWNGELRKLNGAEINNADADPGTICGGRIKFCDLETATVNSYNFPFYWLANGMGPEKVVQAAKDAGVRHMFADGAGTPIDLHKTDKSKWTKSFDNEVGFGQYRVVPLEHANGVATIVGGGVYHKAHFVKSVKQRNEITGKMSSIKVNKDERDGEQVFPADQMSNLTGVLQKIPAKAENALRNGRPAVGKTGTWEFKGGSGDTWMVGGIPQLATTVWVGNSGDKIKLKNKDGSTMFGSGTPAAVWEMFLDKATAALDMKVEQFPPRQDTGDPNSELQNGEEPPPPPVVEQPRDDDCDIPILCRDDDDNGNNGNNGGDNGGNNPTPRDPTPGTDPPTTLPTEPIPGDGSGNGGGTSNGNTFPDD